MQQMMQELEMEEKKASIMARKAQAMLSQARAQKVLSEIEKGALDDTKLEELALRARELDVREQETERSMGIRERAQAAQEAKIAMDDDYRYTELLAQMEQKQQEQQAARQAAQSPQTPDKE